jgi:nucleotide-binding universal stress UspA family protein
MTTKDPQSKEPAVSTILVGVDESERSRDATAFARDLASTAGATVVVANVFPYDDRPSRMASAEFRHALETDAVKVVRDMSGPLADLGHDRVQTAVAARLSAAHGLHDLAEMERAALIVVGSSHVGTAGRVMPGSTGERLLHGAPCPVAIVPQGYRDRAGELHRVGVAYDGSPESTAAVRGAIEIARATGAELRVIRVMDALGYSTPALMGGPGYVELRGTIEQELRAELDEALGRIPADVSARAVFVTGDPAHELAEQSGTLDLLVTGSRGYGPLRAVMAGAVIGRVLRDAACPVLVVPRGVESPLGALFARGAETPA